VVNTYFEAYVTQFCSHIMRIIRRCGGLSRSRQHPKLNAHGRIERHRGKADTG
jgi:hypothetical protein